MSDQPIFRTIREQVTQRLRDDVMGGVFKPGESLREVVLSKRYAVSRSPIRDAFLQLAQEGLLVATPNCGVKVGVKLDEEIQPLVVDIRLKVEHFAIERLIEKIEAEGLTTLLLRLDKNREACKSGALPAIIKSDMEFHQAILELSGSDKLLGVWKHVTSAMLLHYDRHRDWMESYTEHLAIFSAIKKRDKRAAKAALNLNIR